MGHYAKEVSEVGAVLGDLAKKYWLMRGGKGGLVLGGGVLLEGWRSGQGGDCFLQRWV